MAMPFARPKKVYTEAELYEYAVGALGRRMRTVAELKRLLRQKVEADTEFGVGFHFSPQQALQFRDRAHAASQGADGVLVQLGFGINLLLGTGESHRHHLNARWR